MRFDDPSFIHTCCCCFCGYGYGCCSEATKTTIHTSCFQFPFVLKLMNFIISPVQRLSLPFYHFRCFFFFSFLSCCCFLLLFMQKLFRAIANISNKRLNKMWNSWRLNSKKERAREHTQNETEITLTHCHTHTHSHYSI